MRNSAKRNLQNHGAKSKLKTLEKNYLAVIGAGKKDEAEPLFRGLCSALDKASKHGVIHEAKANRKKSRLAARLGALT